MMTQKGNTNVETTMFKIENIPFGNGNKSTVNPYAQFPLSALKVDQSFVVPLSMKKLVRNAVQSAKRKHTSKDFRTKTVRVRRAKKVRVYRIK